MNLWTIVLYISIGSVIKMSIYSIDESSKLTELAVTDLRLELDGTLRYLPLIFRVVGQALRLRFINLECRRRD